jgi:dephospho-CoA kinase
VVARAAVAPGTAGLAAVVERFGRAVLDPSGSLDRRKLAEVVFADPGARHALEAIVHPVVQKTIDDWFAALGSRHLFAVADIPLLFETGRAGEFDKVIVTACAPETQLRRIMQRDHLTEEEARLRIVAQLPLEEKVRKADHVIRTDRAVDATNAEVRTVVERLTRELAG